MRGIHYNQTPWQNIMHSIWWSRKDWFCSSHLQARCSRACKHFCKGTITVIFASSWRCLNRLRYIFFVYFLARLIVHTLKCIFIDLSISIFLVTISSSTSESPDTAQKRSFPLKVSSVSVRKPFFTKLWIQSHLLKKSLMASFIFSVVWHSHLTLIEQPPL